MIADLNVELQPIYNDPEIIQIVGICNEAIIYGQSDKLYMHLSQSMKDYMPVSAFEKMRLDTLKPLGVYEMTDKLEQDTLFPNILHQYIRYEHLGLKIRYVFINRLIHGLWLGYYEL